MNTIALSVKNITSVGRWWMRWVARGGSFHWQARPMTDLRNDDQLRRYREIEHQRRHIPRDESQAAPRPKQVVNLAAWRLQRARRTG